MCQDTTAHTADTAKYSHQVLFYVADFITKTAFAVLTVPAMVYSTPVPRTTMIVNQYFPPYRLPGNFIFNHF